MKNLLAALALLTFTSLVQAQTDAGAFHPMDALTAAEIDSAVKLLNAAGDADKDTTYPAVTLREAPKDVINAWEKGKPFTRTAFVILRKQNKTFEAIVDLTGNKVTSFIEKPGEEPMVMDYEWVAARDKFMADPRFKAAIAKRGLKNMKQVFCTPNSAGTFKGDGYDGRRILKIPCYSGENRLHPQLARPIEGLMGVVDSNTGEVIDVLDRDIVELPPAPKGYGADLPKLDKPTNPIAMIAPAGPNIELSGNLEIKWNRWQMHARADKRAGLVLSLVKFDDGKKLRDIAYQMNVSELFVPYMSPDPTWSYRTFLDAGEFGMGYLIASLKLGVDCPPNAIFIDLTFPNDKGGVYTRPAALCVFERANGDPAWRHFTGSTKSVTGVPQVDLVVRHIPTVGNYDYVIDYVFSPQGNITLRVGATGFDAVQSSAAANMESPTALADTAYGTLIAPYNVAINHDHYFNFRLDLDVDGPQNSLVRDAFFAEPAKDSKTRKSLWTLKTGRYTAEGPIVPDHTATGGETWRVVNTNQKTDLKFNPSYWIDTHHQPVSILDPADPPQTRAGFTAQNLWVTKRRDDQYWAAGLYPNLSTKDEGLPEFVSKKESITNEDLVLWYTMGFRHAPRPEDFPILPTFWHEMTLRPAFFFDHDPSMTFNPGALEPPKE